MHEIKKKIRAYFEQMPAFRENPFTFGDDDSVIDLGLIDSFGIMELIVYIYEEIGVEIEEYDMEQKNFESVNAIENIITKHGR